MFSIDLQNLQSKTDSSGEGSYQLIQSINSWLVPDEIELEGDNLIWRAEPTHLIEPPPDQGTVRLMLESFAELGEEATPDVKILEYARRWGVLALCEHGLPACHILRGYLDPRNPNVFLHQHCRPLSRNDSLRYEPLERWRHYARQANAIIKLANSLHQGLIGDVTYWQILAAQSLAQREMPPDSLQAAKFRLSVVVNRWLEMTDIRPRFIWVGDDPMFTLSPPVFSLTAESITLMSVLAVQLMLRINRSVTLARCSNPDCGETFELKPGQSIKSSHYCRKCQKGNAPRRIAARRFRLRQKENPQRAKRRRLTAVEQESIFSQWEGADKKGPELYKELANAYNVSESAIRALIRRRKGDGNETGRKEGK